MHWYFLFTFPVFRLGGGQDAQEIEEARRHTPIEGGMTGRIGKESNGSPT